MIYFIYAMIVGTGLFACVVAWFAVEAWRDLGWQEGLLWCFRFITVLALHGAFWIARGTQVMIDAWVKP